MHYIVKLFICAVVLWVAIEIAIWIINRTIKDLKRRHILRKLVIYFGAFIILLCVGRVVVHRINLSVVLGIGSAGVALALQEVVLCFAGWLFILIKRPYDLGDRIELNGIKGDVIDIRTLQTTLLEVGNWVDGEQSTGRIVHIPNSFVFKSQCYNYTRGFEFIWNELSIVVTFDSNWKKAKDIFLEIGNRWAQDRDSIAAERIKRMADNYMIHFNKFTPIVYTSVVDSGIKLTLRYMIEAKQRRTTASRIYEELLEEFAKHQDINFAYITYTIDLKTSNGVVKDLTKEA